ncbi:MAG: NAD-dependent epimerase/dehydratase family protein [Deltaproteobacteria bacterium]|nr:NAD-dependent epimerase/dehydratase family protein [Deltaproteobacteria bacterium]
MHALVTGGAGFIGSHLALRLLGDGHRVTVVDNLSTGYRGQVPAGADFVYADLGNPLHLHRLDELRPDVVFHLGGQSSGWISMDAPLGDLEDNLRSTILLADWALAHGCRRFLYASSESVYGEGSKERPFTETTLPRPLTYYGCSKLAAEHYLRVKADNSPLQHTCLRLFTVYGPGQDLANMRQGIVSIYLAYAAKGEPVVVKGSLDRTRDLVFVDDAVAAFIAAAAEPRTIGLELNVATGVSTRLGDLIREMVAAVGVPDLPVHPEAGTPGDVLHSFGDASRLTALTGWKPVVSASEGLRRAVARYRRSTPG